ncbi:tRNA uridine-5-carboxymethylaminomethyl(34) synthesis GTPase MnmE [Gaopeijia maritima]|uniref:tRNA modification GTPase MnmE n=1 Tax=Gaopeijia maritima TaxID=3119007 RepID=A0ABU9E6S9_9BACT
MAALATAPGSAAIAVVRISGPDTARVLAATIPEWGEDRLAPRVVHLVRVVHPETSEVLDRGLLTWFPGPASYTGEHVAEFSGHGGALLARRVEEAFLAAGARAAEPGEFTRRAYLNGKLDLVQAEAVDDLIRGRSPRLQREALRQLDRHLSRRLAELRSEVVDLEALLAHHIDFPDEDEPPVSAEVVARRARSLADRLERLGATAPEGERLRTGALVVLAGRPNAGKSSLYNALVGEERALVTAVAGTTRDALEVEVSMDGYPVRLVDTAGIRDEGGEVERLGIEVARRFVGGADLVLHCVPVGSEVPVDEADWLEGLGVPVLRVGTMSDLADDAGAGPEAGDEEPALRVSAVSGEGLDRLRVQVARRCFAGLGSAPADAPVLTRARQARAVARAAVEVRAFAAALDEGVPAEFAAAHLRSAETALEEVVGLVEVDDVLDRVFRTFCVGK